MPRKAIKATTPAKSSSKRVAPDRPTPTRQSKRAKATAKTYAEPESDEDIADSKPQPPEESEDSRASDYDVEESQDDFPESDDQEEEYSEEEAKPKRGTPKGRSAKGATLPIHKKKGSEKELWKDGAKLAPGTQLVIKKPKARDAGDIPYHNNTIHPNTMLFLKDLASNNDRQWLKMHDPDYRAAQDDFSTFLEALSEKVIEADETIPELPVKDIVFRIYRDVRFSKDQTPYKTHFSAAWSRTGRKGPYAAYYVQVMPDGGSFVGIRKEFLGGVANDEQKAVRAFINMPQNKSNALKKNPKGYDKGHPDIELLRLKNFTLGTRLSDEEVVGANGLERIARLIACMVPFVTYLNSVVMPDEEESDSSDEDDGDNEEGHGAEGSHPE